MEAFKEKLGITVKNKWVVIVFFSLFNSWIWVILMKSILLAAILFICTLTLFSLMCFFNGRVLLLLSSCFLITYLIYIKLFFNPIWELSPTDIYKINFQRTEYPKVLGSIFQNKAIYSLNLLKERVFSVLDLNLYFFASHPRENHSDFEKYNFVLLPLFIFGIFTLTKRHLKIVCFYLLFALSVYIFSFTSSELGPFLFFPLTSAITAKGFLTIWTR